MKYYIVNTVVRDGEFEYFSQSPIQAKNEAEALKRATDEAEEWTADDYRENRVSVHHELTKEEFEVICKHVY